MNNFGLKQYETATKEFLKILAEGAYIHSPQDFTSLFHNDFMVAAAEILVENSDLK